MLYHNNYFHVFYYYYDDDYLTHQGGPLIRFLLLFFKKLMTVTLHGDYHRMPDNEATYYNLLTGYLESVDYYACMMVNKSAKKVSFRITPSDPILLMGLLSAVKDLNNQFGIKVAFSKSIKTSQSISFDIDINS